MNYENLRRRQDEHCSALLKQYIPYKVQSATSVGGNGFKFLVQHNIKNFWHQWTPRGCIPLPADQQDAYHEARRNRSPRTDDEKALLATFCETPEASLSCRAMLPNEVLFESDTEDYRIQRVVATRLLKACRSLGWEPLICWTGGKSLHLHLWLDMATIKLGPLLEKRLARISESMPALLLRTEIPRLVRLVIYEDVLRRAELHDTQLLDEVVVKYRSRRMVRALGARHSKTGLFKVFLPAVPQERPDASDPSFPEHLPPPADLGPMATSVRARIIIELERLVRRRQRRFSPMRSAVEPCWRVKPGTRNRTLLLWAFRQARRHVPIEDALREQETWTQDVDGNQHEDRKVVEYAYLQEAEQTPLKSHLKGAPPNISEVINNVY